MRRRAIFARLASGRLDWLWLSAAVLCLFLFKSASLPLMDPDESRCALVVKEMLQGGDWLMPHLTGQVYYDKPAPFFWLAAASQKLTGSAELGGRLVSALAAWLAVLITWSWARRLAGRAAGLTAGAALATAGEFLFVAHWYRMDMAFTAAMWAALWWLARGQAAAAEDPSAKARRAGWIGFYGFAALAVLFKGPAGLALPLLVILVWMIARRQYSRLTGALSPLGLALFAAIAAPWYVAAMWRDPSYFQYFFIRNNLERFATVSVGRHWPGILYVPLLLGGLMPWTLLLPGVIVRSIRRGGLAVSQRGQVLLLWLAVLLPLGVVAVSSGKEAQYLMPLFAPLAVLIGVFLGNWSDSAQPHRLMRLGLPALAISAVGVAALPMILARRSEFWRWRRCG
jgi:4-amino-4-deoxy-L-arabinose transferase-like glycosyltransferase